MPLTSGKMAPEHDQKIRKNIRYIKENIDAKEMTDHFIEEGIFDFPDIDKINGYNPNTKENRNNCFMQLLFASGPRAYEVFLRALRENGQDFIIEALENTPVNPAEPVGNDRLAWLSTISPHVRAKRLVERDLSRFSQAFGSDWDLVMYEFGLTKPEVDHSKMENPTSVPMQIYNCLMRWKMKVASEATLDNFVQILAGCDSATIDWDVLKRKAQDMRV